MTSVSLFQCYSFSSCRPWSSGDQETKNICGLFLSYFSKKFFKEILSELSAHEICLDVSVSFFFILQAVIIRCSRNKKICAILFRKLSWSTMWKNGALMIKKSFRPSALNFWSIAQFIRWLKSQNIFLTCYWSGQCLRELY